MIPVNPGSLFCPLLSISVTDPTRALIAADGLEHLLGSQPLAPGHLLSLVGFALCG